MRIDCHIHTRTFSACSVLDPDRACQRALENGLDAIVLTEHQVQWPERALSVLRNSYPRLAIYSGVEVSLKEGFDVVLIGLEQDISFPPFPHRISLKKLMKAIAGLKGDSFLFLAHAFRWTNEFSPNLDTVLAQVQGIEMNSINILKGNWRKEEDRFLPADAHLYHMARTSCSLLPLYNTDSHSENTVGALASHIDEDPPDNGSDLARLLKKSVPVEYQNPDLLRQILS